MQESGAVIGLLKKARAAADRIVWLDDSDSIGVTHFELLPYLDRYLKKQLFKDRSLYAEEFYGGRIFSDFYHRRFQVEDPVPFAQFFPLDPALSEKLGLSWNIGLGYLYRTFGWMGRIRRYAPALVPVRSKCSSLHSARSRPSHPFLRTSPLPARPGATAS